MGQSWTKLSVVGFQMWVWDCVCVHGGEDAAAGERKEQNQEGLWTVLTISSSNSSFHPLDSSAPPVNVSLLLSPFTMPTSQS